MSFHANDFALYVHDGQIALEKQTYYLAIHQQLRIWHEFISARIQTYNIMTGNEKTVESSK